LAAELNQINWVALGARLQGARKAAGKKQEDAAALLGVSRSTVVAIEQGKRRLTPAELMKLAKLYGQDLNTLLRREAPATDLAVVFRARFERRLIEVVGESQVEQAVAQLQRYAENYLELERILASPMPKRYPAEYSYAGIAALIAADEIAMQERDRLNLGDGPISDLRSLLENEVGLRIFYLSLPSQMAGMFGYTEELGGCIAINRKHPSDRRRMTLAHEYAHFLTSRTSPDIQVLSAYERYPESERFANAFASRLLLPESGVRRQIRAHLQATGTFTLGDLLRFARYYGVSFEAYGYRLEEMGILPAGTVEGYKAGGLKVRKAREIVGITPEGHAEVPMLPERYRLLAVLAYLKEEITEGQLAQFLGVHRLEARRVVEELRGQLTLDDEGRPGWAPLPVEEQVSLRSR
jgi:Zn-dependent peptidase ImmA (M78 family)/DNA-binding XRE family transcriptional regulator